MKDFNSVRQEVQRLIDQIKKSDSGDEEAMIAIGSENDSGWIPGGCGEDILKGFHDPNLSGIEKSWSFCLRRKRDGFAICIVDMVEEPGSYCYSYIENGEEYVEDISVFHEDDRVSSVHSHGDRGMCLHYM